MSPHPYPVNPGWSARETKPVALHCACGQSFESKEQWLPEVAQAFTGAWWKVHCGTGHGPSDVHIEKPEAVALVGTYVHAHDDLSGRVKDLVRTLREHAQDLAQAEPTDTKELEGKLDGLITSVLEDIAALDDAMEAYNQLPEEPSR